MINIVMKYSLKMLIVVGFLSAGIASVFAHDCAYAKKVIDSAMASGSEDVDHAVVSSEKETFLNFMPANVGKEVEKSTKGVVSEDIVERDRQLLEEDLSKWMGRLQFDMQGNLAFSKYNFTDLVESYSRADMWNEIKLSLWLDEKKTLAPYVSYVPTTVSKIDRNFWWQRNNQVNTGVQWYPFPEVEGMDFLRSVRFFVQYSTRDYYANRTPGLPYLVERYGRQVYSWLAEEIQGKLNALETQNFDLQIGCDYYYDTIFDGGPFAISVWSQLAWFKTNFVSLEDQSNYNAIVSKGDVKYGPVKVVGGSLIYPYMTAQWTVSPAHKERFFENYLRVGMGVRYYPWAISSEKSSGVLWKNLLKRFHVFGEFLYNAAWLGDDAPDSVKDYDLRVGVGYSTSGFFREKSSETIKPIPVFTEDVSRSKMKESTDSKKGSSCCSKSSCEYSNGFSAGSTVSCSGDVAAENCDICGVCKRPCCAS